MSVGHIGRNSPGERRYAYDVRAYLRARTLAHHFWPLAQEAAHHDLQELHADVLFLHLEDSHGTAALVQVAHEDAIVGLLRRHLLLAKHPSAGRFLSHLDAVSELLPGSDAVQLGLWGILWRPGGGTYNIL